jgi:hypothetical protein
MLLILKVKKKKWRSCSRVPTAREIEHLWHIVYKSDVRCLSLARLTQVKNMKVRNIQHSLLYDSILGVYPDVIKCQRFSEVKRYDKKGYMPKSNYNAKILEYDHRRSTYVSNDFQWCIKGNSFQSIDNTLMYSDVYNRIRYSGHSHAVQSMRLEFQFKFFGLIEFFLGDGITSFITSVTCDGYTYGTIDIFISEEKYDLNFGVSIWFHPDCTQELEYRAIITRNFIFDTDKDISIGSECFRMSTSNHRYDSVFDQVFDVQFETLEKKEVYPILSSIEISTNEGSEFDLTKLRNNNVRPVYRERDGVIELIVDDSYKNDFPIIKDRFKWYDRCLELVHRLHSDKERNKEEVCYECERYYHSHHGNIVNVMIRMREENARLKFFNET